MLALLSMLGGGLFRLLPEVLKLFSDKSDKKHELEMTRLQLEIDQARATQAIDIANAQASVAAAAGQMQALSEAIKGQAQLTGVKWVDSVNATVRPFVTYWWMILLTIHKILAVIVYFTLSTGTLKDFNDNLWAENDWNILLSILSFWFVDRVMRTQQGCK